MLTEASASDILHRREEKLKGETLVRTCLPKRLAKVGPISSTKREDVGCGGEKELGERMKKLRC